MLGLGNSLITSGKPGVTIVTDNLVLNHGYALNPVQPVSDGAAYFDGSGHITMGDNNDMGTNDVSVACWFFPITDTVHGAGLVTKQANYNANIVGYGLYFRHSTSKVYFNIGDGTNGSRTDEDLSTVGLSYNQWIHAAGTYDQSRGVNKLYINGVEVDSATQAVDTLNNSTLLKLGHAGAYYNGYIANAAIWSEVLTQAQIKSIMWKQYSDLTSSETTNLASWWNLSADANDSKASVDGTLSGTV